jgi:gamma-glutamyltranspeptidase/glutathione hydrolase
MADKRHFMTNVNPNTFTTRPEIEGTFGVVTSTHWIATAVGMGILERGGNAFDAGVATAFTLQVVEPHLNGPGGDVPVIVYDVKRGKPEVICGQGVAPAGAPSNIIAAKASTLCPAPACSRPACPAPSRPG